VDQGVAALHAQQPLCSHLDLSPWPDSLMPFQAIEHEDVCPSLATFSIPNKGKCTRSVIGVAGSLLFAKFVFGAFVCPALYVVLNYPKVTALFELIMRCILRNPAYRRSRDLDFQLVWVALQLVFGVVVGFVTPVLLPLLALRLWMDRAAFHHAVGECAQPIGVKATISQDFMSVLSVFSLGLATTLVAALFAWNDLHGTMLVCVGMPCSAAVGYAVFRQRACCGKPRPVRGDDSAPVAANLAPCGEMKRDEPAAVQLQGTGGFAEPLLRHAS